MMTITLVQKPEEEKRKGGIQWVQKEIVVLTVDNYVREKSQNVQTNTLEEVRVTRTVGHCNLNDLMSVIDVARTPLCKPKGVNVRRFCIVRLKRPSGTLGCDALDPGHAVGGMALESSL
jgi:hypothetical protein